MAFDYSGVVTLADEILREYGQTITITSKSAGAYDVATGAAAVTQSTQTATGVVFDYGTRAIDGTLIKVGDKQLLLSASGLTAPAISDIAIIGNISYVITHIKEVNPAGTSIMLDCNIRK